MDIWVSRNWKTANYCDDSYKFMLIHANQKAIKIYYNCFLDSRFNFVGTAKLEKCMAGERLLYERLILLEHRFL